MSQTISWIDYQPGEQPEFSFRELNAIRGVLASAVKELSSRENAESPAEAKEYYLEQLAIHASALGKANKALEPKP